MKVYRFLRWNAVNNLETLGELNEIDNFKDYGLISPSASYLWRYPSIPNGASNTFCPETEMTKYFFRSLADALCIVSQLGAPINTVIEIDLPEELLRKYIGLGFYYVGRKSQVEFRIPYKNLYQELAKNHQDYFYQALAYYNNHLNKENLHLYESYKAIEGLLDQVSYPHIHDIHRLSIYPLFCFEPIHVESIDIHELAIFRIKRIVERFQEEREKRFQYGQKIDLIARGKSSEISSEMDECKNQLFDFASPIIEEENQELKRILKK